MRYLNRLKYQKNCYIKDHVAPHVHFITYYIKTPTHEFASAQENNVGAKFIEISSNEGSIPGYDKINNPYDGFDLNTKEMKIHQILSTLEMDIDCERTNAFQSKEMEMSKGKPKVTPKESKVLKCIYYCCFYIYNNCIL